MLSKMYYLSQLIMIIRPCHKGLLIFFDLPVNSLSGFFFRLVELNYKKEGKKRGGGREKEKEKEKKRGKEEGRKE